VRAALREIGYDAIGAETVTTALRHPAVEKSRGPVRAIVLDDAAVHGAPADTVERLLARHASPAVVVITSAVKEPPRVRGARVLRRPTSIGEIVSAVRDLLPLPPAEQVPLDV